MNISRICKWAGLLLVLLPQLGLAAEITLTMRYRGEASGRFLNTNPPAEFCAVWPASCTDNGSGRYTVDLPIRYEKTWINSVPDVKDRWYMQLPAARKVQVVSDSGQQFTLDFSFRSISQFVERTSSSGNSPSFARGGCSLIFSIGNAYRSRFLWKVDNPQAPQPCYNSENTNVGLVSTGRVQQFSASYTLMMPRPIGMPQGVYRGTVTYTIGPGGDFDFGNAVSDQHDTHLTVNFELDVQHDLYLQFPPGSDHAVLEPPGGWMAWLGGRGVPSRLYRDLPLRIWSTGPIKLYKRCQHELAGICGLRENSGHMVPVQVAVTLPAGMQHNGNPITRVAVPTHEAEALQIESVSTVWSQPGQLHFEVAGSDVPSMLAHPGSRYEGLVTVVFEAQM